MLYRVTVGYEIVVEARSGIDAERIAEDTVGSGNEHATRVHSERVICRGDIPDGWENSIPWGDDSHATVSQRIAAPTSGDGGKG